MWAKRAKPKDPSGFTAIVGIDPGLAGSGWAVSRAPGTIAGAGIVQTPNKLRVAPWHLRAQYIGSDTVAAILATLRPPRPRRVIVIAEFPVYMTSGNRSASWTSNDMQKTCFLVGWMAGLLPFEWEFWPVTPNDWKGNLPKEVVINRVSKVLGAKAVRNLGLKSHDWDAAGIALWGWEQK